MTRIAENHAPASFNHAPFRVACLLALIGAAASPARAELPTAVGVDGDPFPAQVTAIDADWQITFDTGDQSRVLPAAGLVRWGDFVERPREPILVLAGGGLLVAEVTAGDKEHLTVDSALFGQIELPLDLLAGIVFYPPAETRRRDLLLDRLDRATGTSDRLVLGNGDEVPGLVEAVDRDTVTLRTDAGPLKTEIRRIAAVIFNPDLKRKIEHRGPRAWSGFADGSRLLATQLLVAQSSLAITTTGGRTWKTLPEELVCLQPRTRRVTYLSGLKPAEYRHVPFLTMKWPYGTDRNATGSLLRCDGRLHLFGLGLHSASRLTYALDRPYQRFQAELGIDDSTDAGGSVRFRVFVDGRQQYTSPTVRGGTAPVPISVDLAGAKRLDLVVDFAERADELDHANWLGARLVGPEVPDSEPRNGPAVSPESPGH